MAGGDARDVEHEAAEGAWREAGQHAVFCVPGGPAGGVEKEGALLAVERAEMPPVVGRDANAGSGGDVEARFIEHHDDVRPTSRRVAAVGRDERKLTRGRAAGVGVEPSLAEQLRYGGDARAHEIGDVIDALERLPGLLGHRKRQTREGREARGAAERGDPPAHFEWIEAPD